MLLIFISNKSHLNLTYYCQIKSLTIICLYCPKISVIERIITVTFLLFLSVLTTICRLALYLPAVAVVFNIEYKFQLILVVLNNIQIFPKRKKSLFLFIIYNIIIIIIIIIT